MRRCPARGDLQLTSRSVARGPRRPSRQAVRQGCLRESASFADVRSGGRRRARLIELLADRRVERLNVLHEKLWPNCTRKRAYNRLGQLAKAGYLQQLVRPVPLARPSVERRPTQHLYVLGPKAPAAMRLRNRPSRKLDSLPMSFIDHQLATNRVGDWLGVRLIGEIEASAASTRRHRPDPGYVASPDDSGRELMLLEVDLGHYSRARILEKAEGFRKHPTARGIVFVCSTEKRAYRVAAWIREGRGSGFMRRCYVFTMDEIRRGARFAPGSAPTATPAESLDSYDRVLGDPGCT